MKRQETFSKNRKEFDSMELQTELENARRQIAERDAHIAQLHKENSGFQQLNELQAQIQQISIQMNERDMKILELEARASNSRSDVDKCLKESQIPDTIKQLPPYNGDPKSLCTWLDCVERVLNLYIELRHKPVYAIWLSQVRNKITDRANDALVKNHTPLQWEHIKATLISYFGDKRDLSTLTSKIGFLRQRSKSLNEFYHEAESLYADINANIHLDPENRGHEAAIMRVIELIIRNAFIDGLNDNLANYTRSGRPTSLLSAYQIAEDYANAEERRREKFHSSPGHNQKPFSIPSKPFPIQPNFRLMNNYIKAPPIPKKPFPRPERMEIDPSIRVNYMNRPKFPQQFPRQNPFSRPQAQQFRAQNTPFAQNQPFNTFHKPQHQNQPFASFHKPQYQNQPKFVVEELTNTEQNNNLTYQDTGDYYTESYYCSDGYEQTNEPNVENSEEEAADNLNFQRGTDTSPKT